MRLSYRITLLVSLLVAVLSTAPLSAGTKQENKVLAARWVYEEVLQNPQRRLPRGLLVATQCVAVFPGVVEAAFGLGGRHGTGVISCRNDEGAWSPPAFLKVSAGSIGLQIGYQAEDLVFFFVSDRAVKALLEPRFMLGGDVSVAAGPYSDTAGVTSAAELSQDIYTYASARGLFAGAAVEGLRVAMSPKAIRKYYGHYVWPGAILFEHDVPILPPQAQEFIDGLAAVAWE